MDFLGDRHLDQYGALFEQLADATSGGPKSHPLRGNAESKSEIGPMRNVVRSPTVGAGNPTPTSSLTRRRTRSPRGDTRVEQGGTKN
jgi:hypothetical protein